MYADIVSTLKSLETHGSKFGTERTRALLDRLGSPDDKLKIIHVAGTNGKGSTCEYLTQILMAAGYKVGTFVSPEVYDYAEKFCVDDKPIAKGKLAFYLQTAYEESHRVEDTPTAFEIETAAAMFAFYREGCQYAVVECGMGGRLDATNAIHNKVMAVILSIGLEHTAVLGDGIEQICAHKAGIIQNCPAVVSAYQTPEGMKYFKKLPVTIAEGVELVSTNEDTQTFRYRGDEYTIAMYGTPQMYNAAVAVEVAIKLHLRNIAIKAGLKRAKILGRVERIVKNGVTYVLDGSHNPQSFTPFLEWARAHGGVDTLIYGCLADKDVHNASAQLAEITQNVIAVAPNSYRAMELNNIRQTLEVNFKEVQTANSVEQALQKATGNCIAVCGSFTLLKEAKDCILQGALS